MLLSNYFSKIKINKTYIMDYFKHLFEDQNGNIFKDF